jgi:hypothetical protein
MRDSSAGRNASDRFQAAGGIMSRCPTSRAGPKPCRASSAAMASGANRTVAAFAARLNDAMDLDQVRDDLVGVVQKALEPGHVSVWVSGPAHRTPVGHQAPAVQFFQPGSS